MKVLSFVALADRTALDVVTHQPRSVWVEEGRAQPMQGLLGALVADAVSRVEELRPQGGRRWDEHTAVVQDEAVNDGSSCSGLAVGDQLLRRDDLRQGLRLLAEVVVEGE